MWWWAPTNAHHCAIQPTITLTTFIYCILQCTNNATSSLHKNFQEDHLNSRRFPGFPGFPGGFSNSRRFPGFPGVVDTLSDDSIAMYTRLTAFYHSCLCDAYNNNDLYSTIMSWRCCSDTVTWTWFSIIATSSVSAQSQIIRQSVPRCRRS